MKRTWHEKILFPIVLHLFIIFPMMSQTLKIEGKVTDTNGETLTGASVVLKGTTIGTTTDINGNYSFDITIEKQQALIFTYIGYKTVEVNVLENQRRYDVQMEETSTGLDEVVVVAYGTQKKANLTGAVSSLHIDDVKDIPASNTASLLQGRMSGVTVSTFSAQPGKDNDVEIRIRGIGTFGNSNPLVLIDGVEGNMSSVSPNDIENVSVLKDAASASIYGVRAANGVILITTKRGKAGENRLSYNVSYGVQQATVLPQFIDSWQWATLFNEQSDAEGTPERKYTPEMIQKLKDKSDPDHFANTKWINEVFRTAPVQNHYISMTGGKNNSNYMASLGYMKQDGIVMGTSTDRTNFRLNADTKYIDMITLGMNVAGTYQKVDEPLNGSYYIFEQARTSRPSVPVKYKNGHWGVFDGNPSFTEPAKNPVFSSTQLANTDVYKFDGKIFADIEPVKNLHFKTNFAYQFNQSDYAGFSPVNAYYSAEGVVKEGGINLLDESSNKAIQWINENLITYYLEADHHIFNFLIGQSSQYNSYKQYRAHGEDFINNNVRVMNAAKITSAYGTMAEATLRSLFGRINYAYKNRYLMELNIRRDESSRIPKKNRVGYFPSLSAGWNIAEENFMKQQSIVNILKLRASWGQLGNQDIGYYPFAQTYRIGMNNYVWGNDKISGAAAVSVANPDIKWETTTTSNIGFDAAFFNNKITSTFDYFDKTTSDILLQLPISAIVGADEAPYVNAAEVKNRGWEASVGYNGKWRDFTFNANANLSHINNKITSVSGRKDWIQGWTINVAGQPIGAYYGYIADGLYTSQNQIDETKNLVGNVGIGDIRLVDINGENGEKDNQITDKDRTILGNPFPKFTYGLNLSAGYKGFDFAVFFQGVAGVDRIVMDYPIAGGSATNTMWNRYSAANPNGTYPRFGNGNYNGLTPSSFWITDASYIRLKNIELGYSFSRDLLQKIKIERLRIFLSAQNALTFTKIKNYDPEKYANDDRSYAYPNAKTFSIGLNFSL